MGWWLAYPVAGAAIGFLAGLLGIGGGMTLVPVMAGLFTLQQLSPDHTVHLALGTSMAAVMFTGTASVRTHHQLGAVDWGVVKRLGPFMALGTLASSFFSGWVDQHRLAQVFSLIVLGAAWQIWSGKKPAAHRTLPGLSVLAGVGLVIGVACGLVSAGGAFLSVPFMLWCGVPMRQAIGTGAAMGVPVAVLGTLGFVFGGTAATGLPSGSVGFVYLPALAGIVVASVVTAPMGARLTQRLPIPALRRLFAVMLIAVALKMLLSYA